MGERFGIGVLSGLGETRIRIGERGAQCYFELLIRIGLCEVDNNYGMTKATTESPRDLVGQISLIYVSTYQRSTPYILLLREYNLLGPCLIKVDLM